jgi:predicted regulator of Ras-like GTPase activity (Roadblock/LC7/MglB family)
MSVIAQALRALRDVQGTHGSFVVTPTGGLVARDLPSVFDSELFAEVGPRVARLYDTFQSSGEEMDACVLRYAEHKLYLRKMSSGLIGVLSSIGINMPALRMVVNLAARRIDPELSRLPANPPEQLTSEIPPKEPPASAPPGARTTPRLPLSYPPAEALDTSGYTGVIAQDGRDSTSPPVSERHVRMYRGRRVDG